MFDFTKKILIDSCYSKKNSYITVHKIKDKVSKVRNKGML